MLKTDKIKRGLILAILMLLMIPMMASANTGEIQESGNLKYVDNGDGTATIKGRVSIEESDLVIPSEIEGLTVTIIGNSAFAQGGTGGLTSVDLPNTITHIGNRAFTRNKFETIDLPSTLTHIGDNAFSENNLEKVDFPSNLRDVGIYAFAQNEITSLDLNSKVSVLKDSVFQDNAIETLVLPMNIAEVEKGAFRNNTLLKDIVIENDFIDISVTSPYYPAAFGTSDYTVYGNSGSKAQAHALAEGKLFLTIDNFDWSKIPGYGTDSPDPDSPADPTNPVENQTHENKATFSLFGGVFDLETSPIVSFGNITFPTEITNYTSTFDGVFTVRDLRGTNEGWRVDVSATQFSKVEPNGGFEDGSGDSKLPTGTLSLKPVKQINRVSDNVGDMPVSSLNEQTIIDDGAVTVVRAEQGSGAGEYEFEFPEDALTLSLDPSKIEVDKVNYPNTGTPYEATITWDLIQAP